MIAAFVAVALAAAAPGSAEIRFSGFVLAKVKQPAGLITPSQALRIAMSAAPDAKALGVQLRGTLYIVKLKQGNRVIKVRVNAGTGAIQ